MPNFFNKYPYTDFHELNLDWLISKMKELQIQFDEFKVVNNITFSGQWDITKQYPAWTIVSDNNIGYVSIQPVPVGVVLTNSDYWVEVIDYTAQIAGLQQRVVNLENTVGDANSGLVKDVNDLEDAVDNIINLSHKNVLIIGDSYNISYDGTTQTNVTSVGVRINNMFIQGNDRASLVGNWAVGGAGFGVKSGQYTFNEYLDAHYIDFTQEQRELVTDVLLFGGYNEIMSNYNDTLSYGKLFATKINTYFPNATLHLAFVGWGTNSSNAAKIATTCLPAYMEIANQSKNTVFVENAQYILHDLSLTGTDGVHPNDLGYNILAKHLGSYLINENVVEVYTKGYPPTFTINPDLAVSTNPVFTQERDNSTSLMRLNNDQVNFTGNVTCDNTGHITLLTFTAGIFRGYDNNSLRIPVRTYVTTTNQGVPTGFYDGFVTINGGNLILTLPGFNTSVNITLIVLFGFNLTALTMSC